MNKRALSTVAVLGTLGLALSACSSTSASTADYPDKPVDLIVGFAPGGSTDTGARILADGLKKELGTSIVVVNKDGAGGQLGLTALSQADPDGYTIGNCGLPAAVVTVIDKSRGAQYTRASFEPLALQVIDPTVIAVAPDSKYQSLDDLVKAAKASPGTLTAATTGIGSDAHLAMLQLEQASGAKFAYVHFAEGQSKAEPAFLGGNVDIYVANVGDITDMVDNDQARVLAVLDQKRSTLLPDAPTAEEQGYDVIQGSARGYCAPAGLPEQVKSKLTDAIGKVIEDPAVKAKMDAQGLETRYMDAQDFTAYWTDTQKRLESVYQLVRASQ